MDFSTEVVADFAVILTVAGFVTYLFHRIKQPLILGYLIAGVIIGPYSPPFSLIRRPDVLSASAELGVLLLLFGIGLEFPLSKLRKVGLKTYAIIAGIELALMFGFSFLAGYLMHWPFQDSLFLGAALGSSSTVVIAKVLTDMGKLKETSTLLMLGILVIEDLAVVLILSLLTSVFGGGTLTPIAMTWTVGKILLFIFGSLAIGSSVLTRVVDWVNHPEYGRGSSEHDEVLVLVVLGMCFGLSMIANLIGLSMAIGAFLMGVIIAGSKSGGRVRLPGLPRERGVRRHILCVGGRAYRYHPVQELHRPPLW